MEGDLHIHTTASDGMVAPARLARMARENALGFFSVTDHNSVAGLTAAAAAAQGGGAQFIPGVELSAQPPDEREIHLLGYGVDASCAALRETCAEIVELKREQVHEIGYRLHRDGVDIDLEELLAGDRTYFGRPVLARLLVRGGVVPDMQRAFSRYLRREGAAYVCMRQFSPRRCIQAIHAAGGLAVLAHPGIGLVDRWIAPFAEMGLDGVEAYRPRCVGNQQLYVEKAAEHFGLVVTGGSDWHGREGEPPLGAFTVPREQLSRFFRALGGDGSSRAEDAENGEARDEG